MIASVSNDDPTSSELLHSVRAIAAQVFDCPLDSIGPGLAYQGIDEWDSVGHMDFLITLEAHYQFHLNVGLVKQLVSIPRIVDFLRQRHDA